MTEKIYGIAMLKAKNKYYVKCNAKGEISTEKTKQDMIDFFTFSYMSSTHSSPYGANTSALIHKIQFQPRVLEMSVKEIGEKLIDLEKGTKFYKLSSGVGSMFGLECNKNNLEKIFNLGESPKLSKK